MTNETDVLELLDDMEKLLRDMDVPICESERIGVGDIEYPCVITPTRLAEARNFLDGLSYGETVDEYVQSQADAIIEELKDSEIPKEQYREYIEDWSANAGDEIGSEVLGRVYCDLGEDYE